MHLTPRPSAALRITAVAAALLAQGCIERYPRPIVDGTPALRPPSTSG